MKIVLLVALTLALALPSAPAGGTTLTPLFRKPIALTAADGVKVYGTLYSSLTIKAVILLFHQAGSSSAEYAPIASRLAMAEFAALAIDQRSGDGMYGPNRTASEFGKSGRQAKYSDALPDLDAAITWAEKTYPNLPIILWGSSYSASLVFIEAARQPANVAAVVAFSPGEYFDDKNLIKKAAARVNIPVFVDSAADKGEVAAALAILNASPAQKRVQYTPRNGIHGSSTLRPDRDPKGYRENWKAVERFLNSL